MRSKIDGYGEMLRWGDTEISAIYVSATLAQLGLFAPTTVITMVAPKKLYIAFPYI
jgi:hypothetical protein